MKLANVLRRFGENFYKLRIGMATSMSDLGSSDRERPNVDAIKFFRVVSEGLVAAILNAADDLRNGFLNRRVDGRVLPLNELRCSPIIVSSKHVSQNGRTEKIYLEMERDAMK